MDILQTKAEAACKRFSVEDPELIDECIETIEPFHFRYDRTDELPL